MILHFIKTQRVWKTSYSLKKTKDKTEKRQRKTVLEDLKVISRKKSAKSL